MTNAKLLALSGLALVLALGATWAADREDEERAVDSLRKIAKAEDAFQAAEKQRTGNAVYGMLSELSNAGLIEAVLGTGTKDGYLFEAARSSTTSELLWFGTASPAAPSNGSHFFFVNQSGAVLEASEALKVDRSTCAPPEEAHPLEALAQDTPAPFATEMSLLAGADLADPHAWDGVAAGQVYVFHATRPERGTLTVAIVSRDAEKVVYTVTEAPEDGKAKAPQQESVRIGSGPGPKEDELERTRVRKESLACSGVSFPCEVQDVRLGGRRGRFWVSRSFPFVLRMVDTDTGADLLELVDVQDRESGTTHCSCGARFEAGARFCAVCGKERPPGESPETQGAAADAACKACGHGLPPNAKFCPGCGKACSP